MTTRSKPSDPAGCERLTVVIPTDAKRTLARIAFETQRPMAEMIRDMVDNWLVGADLPVGVRLPQRLAAIKNKAEKRA